MLKELIPSISLFSAPIPFLLDFGCGDSAVAGDVGLIVKGSIPYFGIDSRQSVISDSLEQSWFRGECMDLEAWMMTRDIPAGSIVFLNDSLDFLCNARVLNVIYRLRSSALTGLVTCTAPEADNSARRMNNGFAAVNVAQFYGRDPSVMVGDRVAVWF